ncbi:MAG: trigger factor [Oscillospiraceae bacterium]|jgi:trigger factor|nr:trigger factor [Oscillospiraceae bacterium]
MEIISSGRKEANVVEVEFKIDAEEFEKAVQAAFLKQRKNIAVPGFRKGKATRRMIEAKYGENVFYEDAVNGVYKTAVPDVVDELKLDIVDSPEVEVKSVSREEGVSFKALFTVKPEVGISGYMGLEAQIRKIEVTEADIDGQIEKMRNDNARIIDVTERPAKRGDIVKLDFEGFCGKEAFEGGAARDFRLEIGGGAFIPGFEEQVEGKSIGEDFEVNVTFPEDYHSENLAGKETVFKCKIREISEKELAELDDEFAKDVSEFDTLEELRGDIRGKLSENGEKIRDMELEREIAEKIVKSLDADVPAVMFENRVDEMARDWSYNNRVRLDDYAARNGMTVEQFKETFRETAEKQVKFRLALEKIAELEGIEVTKDELDEEYEKMAKRSKMTAEKVRGLISEETVADDVKTEKALKLLKDGAKITYK